MATRNDPKDSFGIYGIPLQDHNMYDVLGVHSNASEDELIRAYRKTSRLIHPDRNTNPGAEEMMKLVNRAKDTLLDPVKRRDHDDELRREGTDPLTPGSSIPLLSGWSNYT